MIDHGGCGAGACCAASLAVQLYQWHHLLGALQAQKVSCLSLFRCIAAVKEVSSSPMLV